MEKKVEVTKKEKKISIRNYFLVLIISILTIAIVIYIRSFIVNYRANVSGVSIFSENIQSVHFNDLDYYIPEAGEGILYVSYSNNIKIKDMEKKLYRTIENKQLIDKVIYLDISEYLENDEYINLLKEKFPNIESEINTAPLFIYVKDGVAVEAMSSELKLVDYKVFNKIVEKYDIE